MHTQYLDHILTSKTLDLHIENTILNKAHKSHSNGNLSHLETLLL